MHFSLLCFSLLKGFQKSVTFLCLSYRIFSETVLPVFFHESHGGCSTTRVILLVQQLFRVTSVCLVSSFTLLFVCLFAFRTNFFLEVSSATPPPQSRPIYFVGFISLMYQMCKQPTDLGFFPRRLLSYHRGEVLEGQVPASCLWNQRRCNCRHFPRRKNSVSSQNG